MPGRANRRISSSSRNPVEGCSCTPSDAWTSCRVTPRQMRQLRWMNRCVRSSRVSRSPSVTSLREPHERQRSRTMRTAPLRQKWAGRVPVSSPTRPYNTASELLRPKQEAATQMGRGHSWLRSSPQFSNRRESKTEEPQGRLLPVSPTAAHPLPQLQPRPTLQRLRRPCAGLAATAALRPSADHPGGGPAYTAPSRWKSAG